MNLFKYFFGCCYVCQEDLNDFDLCERCRAQLMPLSNRCVLCRDVCIHLKSHSFVPYGYNEITSSILMQLKYHNNTQIAKLIAQEISNIIPNDIYTLTFVPTSRRKLIERTYNQAQIIAQEISNLRNFKIDPFIFQKTKKTSQQYATLEERRSNALSIELWKPELYQKIIIVDDLIASGSTISRCYNLLRQYYVLHNYEAEISFAALAKSF